MAHIVIPDQDLIDRYTVGETETDTFAFSDKFMNESDLAVYNGSSLIDPADYLVTGIPDASGVGYDGASIVLDTPVTDTVITLTLEAPNKRLTDFPSTGKFNIQQLNSELDQMTILIQQLKQKIDRAISIPISSALTDVSLPDPVANAFITWNTTADGLTTVLVGGETLIVVQASAPDETEYQLWYDSFNGVMKYWDEATGAWYAMAELSQTYAAEAKGYAGSTIIAGYEETSINGDKTIFLKAPWPFEINELVGVNGAGIQNVTLKIDGVAVTGIDTVGISSTESTHTATANNTGIAGQDIVMTVSSASSSAQFAWRVSISRTGT